MDLWIGKMTAVSIGLKNNGFLVTLNKIHKSKIGTLKRLRTFKNCNQDLLNFI